MTGVDRPRIEAAVTELLLAIGEDPSRPGLVRTPKRVADSYAEFFGGLEVDPVSHLLDAVPLGVSDDGLPQTSDAVIVRGIDFRSICEHHLLPFVGIVHVAYLPGERVVGLGKLADVVETLSTRPQLQERLTEEIAEALETGLGARGVLVVMDAVHRCVVARGSRQAGSSTVTVASRGELTDPVARAELMALIGESPRS
ncbi:MULTISPECIES: GTP cyclohydrolase I [unclassified Leifsonia]|uniref:GTP cyclohydrolase I n=1 Tax=unclassified Leifsonia TaxID=2663824 RepID=UPI0006F36ADB|nr:MULTISPECIES: GTP cyclohydrolase I [unclassified Leifsonia]KQX08031.1 GTP cyclohydrolase I [Leifsonia sp. Root1293]KRA12312.1 GTP cyclohydrolase I [Leifsonia sp. Root60]